MRKLKTLAVLSVTALGLLGASASFACMGPQIEGGPKMQRCLEDRDLEADREAMQKRMQERVVYRLEKLGASLSLREDQQAAWTAFQGALLVGAQDARAGLKDHRGLIREMGAMSAPERLRLMEERMASHQAGLKKTREAVEAFYGQLDADQKNVFDAKFSPHEGLRDNMRQLKERGLMPPMQRQAD